MDSKIIKLSTLSTIAATHSRQFLAIGGSVTLHDAVFFSLQQRFRQSPRASNNFIVLSRSDSFKISHIPAVALDAAAINSSKRSKGIRPDS